jgi:hypothetical protein
MKRQETVLRDRGLMARKALTKAGYLTGLEDESLDEDQLIELASSFLADLFHLHLGPQILSAERRDIRALAQKVTMATAASVESDRYYYSP